MRALYLILILIALAVTAGAILYYNTTSEVASVVTPTPSVEPDLKARIDLEIDLLGGSTSKNFSE